MSKSVWEAIARPVRAVLCAALLFAVALGVGAPAASAADACPNAAIRAQQGAGHLPACAAYELITPMGKGTGDVNGTTGFRPSPDGDSFLYTTTAPWESHPSPSAPQYVRYVAHRDEDGWQSRVMDVPAATWPQGQSKIRTVLATSEDLGHVMVGSEFALTPGATPGGGNLYMRDTRTGELTLIATSPNRILSTHKMVFLSGMGPTDIAVGHDGRSAMFSSQVALVPGAPTETGNNTGKLYTWTADGGVEAASVMPPAPGEEEGEIVAGVGALVASAARSVKPWQDILDTVYFAHISGVYARSGGETRPISVSRIEGDPDTPVRGVGLAVSDGGRHALFYTFGANVRLTDSTPTGLGTQFRAMYLYDAVTDDLTYVGATDGTAVPLTLIQMSRDARTIAFQSRLVLAPGAVSGLYNMYVWRDGDLRLVQAPDAGASTTAAGRFIRVLSDSGRYLSFTDSSVTTAQQFGYDNVSAGCPTAAGAPGPCDMVYLYDVVEDELSCVTCREDGAPPVSHSGDPQIVNPGGMALDTHVMQTVADDGTVFFTTLESFSERDSNGMRDVYSYKDGEITLLSRATQGTIARFIDATYDGSSVYIATNDAIDPRDTDRAVDIYMVRSGGGFEYDAPLVEPPCTGEACRGVVSSSPGAPAVGSVSFEGAGNTAGAGGSGSRAVVVSRLRAAAGPVAVLRVRTNQAGRITVAGRAVRGTSRAVRSATTVQLQVRLTARARAALNRRGAIRVGARVRFNPANGSPVTRPVQLRFVSAGSSRGGR